MRIFHKPVFTKFDTPADVIIFDGFKDMDEDKLKALYDSLGLAMTFKDFQFIKDYLRTKRERDPYYDRDTGA